MLKKQIFSSFNPYAFYNLKTIINNDKQESVTNDSLLTIGNNLNENIEFNHKSSVQKEKINTIKEDYELHVLKDLNTIVKNDLKTIVNKNYTKRVKLINIILIKNSYY